MKTVLTYYKNSNTGVVIKKQHFDEIDFTCPDFFYDVWGKKMDNPCLKGFVEISQKKFDREVKKQNKK